MTMRTAFWTGMVASPVILMGAYVAVLTVPIIVRLVVPEVVQAVVK